MQLQSESVLAGGSGTRSGGVRAGYYDNGAGRITAVLHSGRLTYRRTPKQARHETIHPSTLALPSATPSPPPPGREPAAATNRRHGSAKWAPLAMHWPAEPARCHPRSLPSVAGWTAFGTSRSRAPCQPEANPSPSVRGDETLPVGRQKKAAQAPAHSARQPLWAAPPSHARRQPGRRGMLLMLMRRLRPCCCVCCVCCAAPPRSALPFCALRVGSPVGAVEAASGEESSREQSAAQSTRAQQPQQPSDRQEAAASSALPPSFSLYVPTN